MTYKPIPGFEHEYAIAEDGTILSLLTDMHITPSVSKGYLIVKLYKDGKRFNKRVHVLVAQTYLPNPDNLPVVDHIDGNKLNPNVNNLEWVTQAENTKRAYDTGLHKVTGTKVIQLTKDDKEVNTFDTLRDAERQTNVSHTAISRCIKGERKTAGGYKWREQ